jgi:hypothetical protein
MAIAPIRRLFVQDRPSYSCASYRASYIEILQGRGRRLFGQLLKSLRIPGAVQDHHITDPVNNQTIDISVGALFTKISVNGRDYYFHRVTGKYDGAGMGCS